MKSIHAPRAHRKRKEGQTMTTQESDTRLGELILFICQKSENDDLFGDVKLNKLLYYSDFLAYARWGDTITGAEYWNLPEGPAPKRLVQVRRSLLETGSLVIRKSDVIGGYVQKKPIALRPPQRIFGEDQLVLTSDVIYEHRNLNAKEIAEKSHLEWGWKLTKEKDTIDPSTILLSPDPLNDHEIESALARAEAGLVFVS